MFSTIAVMLTLFTAFQSAAPQEADLPLRAQALLDQVIGGEFAKVEEQFTPEMKAALPPGRLAATWSGFIAQAGALKQCEADARVVTIGDKRMVIRRCTFERAQVDVQFAFDSSGKISGMAMRPPAAPEVPYVPPAYA